MNDQFYTIPTEEDLTVEQKLDLPTTSPKFEEPSAEEIEAEGGLQPITREEQVQQNLGNKTPPENPSEIVSESEAANAVAIGEKQTVTLPLDTRAKRMQMWDEMREWRDMEPGEARDKAERNFYQRYYGMDEGYKPRTFQQEIGERLKSYDSAGKTVLGIVADLPMDIIGNLPFGAALDDAYDEATKLDNPVHKFIRDVMGLVVPSMVAGGGIAAGIGMSRLNRVEKFLSAAGLTTGADLFITAMSDQGEDDNAFRALQDLAPSVFGEKGMLPIPNDLVTLDTDTAEVRRQKNLYADGLLSIVGNIIGYAGYLKGGSKPKLDFVKPLDDTAQQYVARETARTSDTNILVEIAEIDEVLKTGRGDKKFIQTLKDKRAELMKKVDSYESLDDYLRAVEEDVAAQTHNAGVNKAARDPDNVDFDPDVSPGFVNDQAMGKQFDEAGQEARNMGEAARINRGEVVGDPPPAITRHALAAADGAGKDARDLVVDFAERANRVGDFEYKVGNFRMRRSELDADAIAYYKRMMSANSVDEIRDFMHTKRSVIQLTDDYAEEIATEGQVRAAYFAYMDLYNQFIGEEVLAASSRAMQTAGAELATQAEGLRRFDYANDTLMTRDLMLKKAAFLYEEVRLNQYVSGNMLQMKNFDPKDGVSNAEQFATILEEFKEGRRRISQEAKTFSENLAELARENPAAMLPLFKAFELTNGEVDSLEKLLAYAQKQLSFRRAFIVNRDTQGATYFGQGLSATLYASKLAGRAIINAFKGNTIELLRKPINAGLGHGVAAMAGDPKAIERFAYYYAASYETAKRAVVDGFSLIKKGFMNPDEFKDFIRKDFQKHADDKTKIFDMLAPTLKAEGKYGELMKLRMAQAMHLFGNSRFGRATQIGMSGIDQGTNVYLATLTARIRAYDNVFSKFGYVDEKALREAEHEVFKSMFDSRGVLLDKAAKNAAGEIALNLDDKAAALANNAIDQYPFLRNFMYFPTSSTNALKLEASYNALGAIPGITKQGDVIWARSDDDIRKALAKHDVDFDKDPNARAIFQNLKREYIGRLAFSGLFYQSMWGFAAAGNIRGSGHYNSARRYRERQDGYVPKTIYLGGKWYSYKGIPGVDPLLTLLGDLAYYAGDADEAMMDNIGRKIQWTLTSMYSDMVLLTGLEPIVKMLGGDDTGMIRLLSGTVSNYVPMGSGINMVTKMFDSTIKNIHNDFVGQIQSRFPVVSKDLPMVIDSWTGQPVGHIDNPWMRAFNAVSPFPMIDGPEPWREKLNTSGWRGLSALKRDSTGSVEYSPEEFEFIQRHFGSQQRWKQMEKILDKPKYKYILGKIRAHRAVGADVGLDDHALDEQKTSLYREMDRVVKEGQLIAEQALLDIRPDLVQSIRNKQLIDLATKRNDIDEVTRLQGVERQRQEQNKEAIERFSQTYRTYFDN